MHTYYGFKGYQQMWNGYRWVWVAVYSGMCPSYSANSISNDPQPWTTA